MKTYVTPNVTVVRLVHACALMSASNNFDGNSIDLDNSNMTEGDGGDAAVKRFNIWDEEWR